MVNESGHWPSTWPVEGGDARATKTATGLGLAVAPTDRLVAHTTPIDGSATGFVQRDQGQLYLHQRIEHGPNGPVAHVDQVDPISLATLARSGPLPAGPGPDGGHGTANSAANSANGAADTATTSAAMRGVGSVAVHANGDLYTVNGCTIHRLNPDCSIVVGRTLPVRSAHQGPFLLQGGSIAVIGGPEGGNGGTSTLTVLDPELEVRDLAPIPGNVSGRPAIGGTLARSYFGGPVDEQWIAVPGRQRIHRFRWERDALVADPLWLPTPSPLGGPVGDLVVADGRVWGLTNTVLDDRTDATWDDPVRLVGVSDASADDVAIIRPTELPGGYVRGGPLVASGVAVAWDSGNGGLAAFDISPGAMGEMLWFQPFRVTAPPLLFGATAELVVNDEQRIDDQPTGEDLVVVDLHTGQVKARVASGSTTSAGRPLTPGWSRDFYACGDGSVTRVETISR
jgi:hypothetical protein